MDVANLDINSVDKFISSLSKSLQALCNGYMDFNRGIEMVGYININIDSESSVDCVLNEKVRRSPETNSMTCVSNSFLAKKEKKKVTRDASCSPLPVISSSQRTSHNQSEDEGFRPLKRHTFEEGHRLIAGSKRYRRDHFNESHSMISQRDRETSESPQASFTRQERGQPNFITESDETRFYQDNSEKGKDFIQQQNIKQETDESNLNADFSPHDVKSECPDSSLENQNISKNGNDDQNLSGNTPSSVPTSSIVYDLLQNQHPPSVPLSDQSLQHSESQIQDQGLEGSYHEDVSSDTDLQVHQSYLPPSNLARELNNPKQLSFLEEGEGSSNTEQFEVIEIGDDDEVQDLFPHPGQYPIGPSHSGFVWSGHGSVDQGHLMMRERNKRPMFMTNEKKERQRWLARMRQRRRRAKLRLQRQGKLEHGGYEKAEF